MVQLVHLIEKHQVSSRVLQTRTISLNFIIPFFCNSTGVKRSFKLHQKCHFQCSLTKQFYRDTSQHQSCIMSQNVFPQEAFKSNLASSLSLVVFGCQKALNLFIVQLNVIYALLSRTLIVVTAELKPCYRRKSF